MTDMLVRLYDHSLESHPLEVAGLRIEIKRAMAADKSQVCGFVATNFGDTATGWVSECEVALTGLPGSCFIAVHDNTLIGFCCYDATAKGMLGPIGVHSDFRCKGVARELASRGITANVVAPGYVDTDMTTSLSDKAKEMMISQIPLGRVGTAEDIAAAVVFLASDQAAYITGQVIHVNGGMYM